MVFRPSWFDPAVPQREECVLSCLLNQAVQSCPDRTFVCFRGGVEWSYAQVYQRARIWAHAFQDLGVARGDRVVAFLPNGPELLLTWFATNLLGACYVPINTAYRGPLLEHVISNSGAKLVVGHARLLERLRDIDTGALQNAICVGGSADVHLQSLETISSNRIPEWNDDIVTPVDLMPWDLQSILFTSGTTGPSKGVLSSYFHQYTVATAAFGYLGPNDRIYVNGPLFHAGGTGSVYSALIRQASAMVVDGFSAKTFWEELRDSRSTATSGLLGSMTVFLAKNSEESDKKNNPLRMTHFYPVTDETISFAQDFGFEYFSGYGSTEIPLPLITDMDTQLKGSCGRPRSGIECRLVDDHDCEVPVGQTGELIIRAEHPWSVTSGYYGMPEATAEAWRNGWFHTGDLLRQDQDGNYYFVDRKKDSIRRRGENISSQEIEKVVLLHPIVKDVGAIGVSSDLGEEDVMIVVESESDSNDDALHLFDFLRDRLPHFMLPRYIRFVKSLPRTPTEKIKKAALRDRGITADSWDRQQAGITVKRETLD